MTAIDFIAISDGVTDYKPQLACLAMFQKQIGIEVNLTQRLNLTLE